MPFERREVPATSPRLLFAPAVVLLCVVVPEFFSNVHISDLADPPTTLLIVLTAYSGLRLSVILATGRGGPLDTCFWLFVYVFVALPALSQEVAQLYPLGGYFSESERVTAAATLLLGTGCYDAGRFVATRSHRARQQERRQQRSVSGFASSRYVLMVVLAVLAAGYFMRRAGGASTFFRSRDAIVGAFFGGAQLPGSLYYKIADQSTAALELTLLQVPILVVLVAWVLMGRTGRRRLAASLSPAGRMLLLVAVSAAVVLNVIVNNPIYNARFWTGTVLISLILAARPLVTPGFTRVFVVGVLFGALVIFPSADVFRHNTASTAPRVPVSQEFLRDVDFDLYQEHLRAVTYVDEHGHTDGRQLLGAALFWLPRSAWPGKPTATGSMVAEAVGQPGLVASSLWTEAYVDFGPAGVVVAFLLLGAGAGVLDRRYRLSVKRSQPGAASLAVVLLAGYEFFLLRGSLLPAVGRLAVLLLLAAAFRTKRATGVDVPEPRTARSAALRSYQGTSL